MREKYDDFLRKNAIIRGKRWIKGGKEEIFTVLGEKYNFGKRREAKISIMWIIYTPAYICSTQPTFVLC